MTEVSAARPSVSSVQQWWVLTARTITPTFRNAELPTLAVASIIFTAAFYIPLKNLMGPVIGGMSSYAQYLTPMMAIQAIAFAAVSAAFRSAVDSVEGINRRFKALPIGRLIPMASRLSATMYRCVIALSIALVAGHVIGFRFYGGTAHTVSFCLLALLIGATLALLGDLIGTWNENPEATLPIMVVPQLIFGLLSVGLQPIQRFPEWIQPFVRNQPVSQWVIAMRALAGDSTPAAGEVNWNVIGPALAWILGAMVILIPLHALVATRRR